MISLTKTEVAASLRRQRFLESLADRLTKSTASKVPVEMAHLLPSPDQHLAGKRDKQKSRSDARRKMVPAFLRKKLMRWWTILKWKLIARSLRAFSSSYWLRQRIISRTIASRFSKMPTRKRWLAAWRKRPDSPTRSESISAASSYVSGENISATNSCSPMKASRPHTRSDT